MNEKLAIVLALLAAAIVMFAVNRPRMDAVAILMLIALPLTGVLRMDEAVAGFGDSNVVLIAVMFVIGGGLVRTGVARRLGDWLHGESLTTYWQDRDALAKVIDRYNHERLHGALGYLRPIDFYRGDPEHLQAERRQKLGEARHRRREENLKLRQPNLPFRDPASVTQCDGWPVPLSVKQNTRRGFFGRGFWPGVAVLEVTVLVLVASFLAQFALWAWVFRHSSEFTTFEHALYHSAVNYTTLGYGDVVMSERWRLLGPLEAVNGVLMSDLAAAGLFAVLTRLGEPPQTLFREGETNLHGPDNIAHASDDVGHRRQKRRAMSFGPP
jgi:hypothetical protein